MVKTGPCLHCGINYTPLWRNGPPEKPVLCNACGSRYKLKGHLENYLPKNVQLQLCHNDFINLHDRTHLHVEDQISNHLLRTDGINSNLWNKTPSRKRSHVMYKRMTPMDEFQRELLSLSECQSQPNVSSEEDITLLHNVNNFIPENEIGLGIILLKTDSDAAYTNPGSLTCSSVDNQAGYELSTSAE